MQYVNCNLCQANDYQQLWRENEFSLVACRKCGLVFLNPRISQQETRLFYKGYLPRYPDEYLLSAENAFAKTALERIDFLQQYNSLYKTKILEIGCGYGHFLHLLQERGCEVYGIEPSSESVSFAAKRLGLRNVTNAVLEEIQSVKDEYDIIALFHVLEHLQDPAAALIQVWEMLKDKGILFLDIPDICELPVTLIEYFELYTNQHLYGFSAITIRELLVQCDFSIDYIGNWPLAVNSFTSNLRVIARKDKKTITKDTSSNDFENVEQKLKLFISGMEDLRLQLQLKAEEWKQKGQRVVIYGAGFHTFALFKFVDISSCNIIGIIDDDALKWGSLLNGYHVYSPDQFIQLRPDVVIISSLGSEDKIYDRIKTLEHSGISVIKIYS